MIDINQIETELGIDYRAAVIQELQHPLLEKHGLSVCIKREDLLHPIISGNKWRKLKYNLLNTLQTGHEHLISMGGPYSNHLHALAYVGYKLNLQTTGFIRGEPPKQESQTLQDLRQWNMQLRFISRDEFREHRQHHEPDSNPPIDIKGYWITEGAANSFALPGIAEMVNDIDGQYDILSLACGTGTTLAGISKVLPNNKSLLGFAALKGESFLENDVDRLLGEHKNNWSINHDYHFGGFAKTSNELLSFIEEFRKHNNIAIDFIYNGKMLYGLFDLIRKDYFKTGQRIIAIHTGGLQGINR